MQMLELSQREEARLYLAVLDVLDVPEAPKNRRERARNEYAAALANHSDPVAIWAALALADYIAAETENHERQVHLRDVAEAYNVSPGTARRALRLCGWVQQTGRRDVWASEPTARDWWTPEPDSTWWATDD